MKSLAGGPCDDAFIRNGTEPSPCDAATRRWVLAATILGSSMAFIDGTVVSVALPLIQTALGASVADAQWIVEAYALFLSSLLLVGGAMGDRMGRRKVFVIGVVVFAASSAACGLAQNVAELIAARAIQGVGGALLTPGSLALISSAFSAGERGRAIGTWSSATAITAALGPVLGGWLAQTVSWRAVFWINLPMAAAVVAISLWKVPESRRPDAPALDTMGALTVTAALGAIVFGLILATSRTLRDPTAIGTIVLGCALFGVFLAIEHRRPDPMLPLDVFGSRAFSGANAVTFCLYGALSAMMFFLPFDLIQAQGFTPTAAGAAFLPLIVLMFALSRWSGGLLDRVGPRLPLTVGPAIAGVGFALQAIPTVGASYWSGFFPGLCLFGLGMAVTVAPLTTVVMNSAPPGESGLASGITNAVSRVAGLLAVAVLGLLVTATFDRSLDRRLASAGLNSVAQRISPSERLKLGAAKPPADLPVDQAREVSDIIARSLAESFRVVALAAAALAVLSAALASFFFPRRR